LAPTSPSEHPTSSASPTSAEPTAPAGAASSAPVPKPEKQEQSRFARGLRRTIAIVIVVAFSVAAIGGIAVMLGDIESDEAFQVIVTTAATGACSVAAFCGASLIGRRVQWFDSVTILLAAATLALSLVSLWGYPYMWDDPIPGTNGLVISDLLLNVLWSLLIVTAVASLSSLILLLSPRSWVVWIGMPITLGLLTLGTCLVLITIWDDRLWEYDWLTRLNGIVWILAALGVVVVPLTSLLLKAGSKPTDAEPTAVAGTSAGDTSSVTDSDSQAGSAAGSTLSPAAQDRLAEAARAEGITADELLERLLDSQTSTAPNPSKDPTPSSKSAPADDSAADPQSHHPRH
jgi:hypothetical protein